MLRRLLKVGLYLLGNLVFVASSLVPKDRNLWLFSSWGGMSFSDNPKHLYLHVLESGKEVNAVWLTKKRSIFHQLVQDGLPAVYAYSGKGLLAQMTAGLVFFTHSVEHEFLPAFVGKSTKRVQLWHGIPLKKIGFDDIHGMSKRRALLKGALFPFLSPKFDLMTACGDYDKAIFKNAFLVDERDVVITGYPRNDALVKSRNVFGEHSCPATFRKVLYLPTFRGKAGSNFDLLERTGFDVVEMSAALKRLNCRLDVKLHAAQAMSESVRSLMNDFDELHLLDPVDDVYQSLHSYDVVIVDYSSIYFDLLLLDIKIIMAPFDLDHYSAKERELYLDYGELTVSSPCTSWRMVLDQLSVLLDGKEALPKKYREIKSRFHCFQDARSSERVLSAVRRKIQSAKQ